MKQSGIAKVLQWEEGGVEMILGEEVFICEIEDIERLWEGASGGVRGEKLIAKVMRSSEAIICSLKKADEFKRLYLLTREACRVSCSNYGNVTRRIVWAWVFSVESIEDVKVLMKTASMFFRIPKSSSESSDDKMAKSRMLLTLRLKIQSFIRSIEEAQQGLMVERDGSYFINSAIMHKWLELIKTPQEAKTLLEYNRSLGTWEYSGEGVFVEEILIKMALL